MKKNIISISVIVILLMLFIEIASNILDPNPSDIDLQLEDIVKKNAVLSTEFGTQRAINVDFYNNETDTVKFDAVLECENGKLFLKGNTKLIQGKWVILSLFRKIDTLNIPMIYSERKML